MITEIAIENFRGIAKGTVSGLKPLTALVGANNSGKSTILEALYIGAADGHVAACSRVTIHRGWLGFESVRSLIYRSNREAVIAFTLGEDQKREFSLRWGVPSLELVQPAKDQAKGLGLTLDDKLLIFQIEYLGRKVNVGFDQSGRSTASASDSTTLKTQLIDFETMRNHKDVELAYSQATGTGGRTKESIIALCKILRPATQSLDILNRDGDYVLCMLDADGSCPLHFAGDGMRRLVLIACNLAAARGGVVLIEEPECFQHPIAMDEFVKLIWAAVAQGTQVVFSTHSLELLAKVFEKEEGRDLDKACLIRTRLTEGKLITGVIDGLEASERLQDVGEDLRR